MTPHRIGAPSNLQPPTPTPTPPSTRPPLHPSTPPPLHPTQHALAKLETSYLAQYAADEWMAQLSVDDGPDARAAHLRYMGVINIDNGRMVGPGSVKLSSELSLDLNSFNSGAAAGWNYQLSPMGPHIQMKADTDWTVMSQYMFFTGFPSTFMTLNAYAQQWKQQYFFGMGVRVM